MAIKIPTQLKFLLGILRHPGEARHRLREIMRIAQAPPRDKALAADELAAVTLVAVDKTDIMGEKLVDIYARNPSPYVSGPKTIYQLESSLRNGMRYFLVMNGKGTAIGTKAFEPKTGMLVGAVTDFEFRGSGFQLSAGKQLRALLAKEGFREFRAEVLTDNTRMQRLMAAAGWEMTPHPKKSDIIVGTIRMDQDNN